MPCSHVTVLHAATRARRRQEAATQSQPELDSLTVGLPAPDWLAEPAAPDIERFSWLLNEGTRLKLMLKLCASLSSALRVLGFDLR